MTSCHSPWQEIITQGPSPSNGCFPPKVCQGESGWIRLSAPSAPQAEKAKAPQGWAASHPCSPRTVQREDEVLRYSRTTETCTPKMVTSQLSAYPHFFCHSWAPSQNCFPSGSLCLFYWAFGELWEGKNQQSVVMRMENHMLHKAAYALCLRCTWKYARINTCQLHNLPRLENSKSLCSYAKNTAWVKFCRLLKLKELIRGLQTQIPRASKQVVLMRKAGQAWPAGNWDGLRTTQTSSFRQVWPLKNTETRKLEIYILLWVLLTFPVLLGHSDLF